MSDNRKFPQALKLIFGLATAAALLYVIQRAAQQFKNSGSIQSDIPAAAGENFPPSSGAIRAAAGKDTFAPSFPEAAAEVQILATAAAPKKTAAANAAADIKEVIRPADPDYALKPEKVSALFADYSSWTEAQKIAEVTAIMDSSFLPHDVLTLFMEEIRNKNNGHLLRNNMANALLSQKHPAPLLEEVFWREFCDTANSQTWRDYALQFYARCARFSPQPVNIRNNLLSLISVPQANIFTATAAMMLTYEWQQHELDIPGNFAEQVEKSLLSAQSSDLQAAGLSVLGRLNAAEKLPQVRKFLQHPSSLVRRAALAALGILGSPADLPLAEAHLRSPDRLTAMAAQSAAAKLKKVSQ